MAAGCTVVLKPAEETPLTAIRLAELALEAFAAGTDDFADAPRFALGHSFGGVLTSLMLAQQPQLFRRAVLLDPVLFSPAMIGVMAVLFSISFRAIRVTVAPLGS